MKKFTLFYFLGLFIAMGCNNSTKTVSTPTDGTNKVLPKSFYKRLEGQLDGKKIIMHLQKKDSDFIGVYYTEGTWLNLLKDSSNSDSLVLWENPTHGYYENENLKQAQFKLKWTGKAFNGYWINAMRNKKYPVNLTENYASDSYAFSFINFSDSISAIPGNKKTPKATISFDYLNALGHSEEVAFLNENLKTTIGLDKNQADWPAGLKALSEKYFTSYKKDIKRLNLKADADFPASQMNYTNSSSEHIVYNDKGFVVIELMKNDYSGGAHGYYSSNFSCYDTKSKKKLKLGDLVKIDSNDLKKIVEQNLREQYHIKPNESLNTLLFDDFLKPNDNFYFNDNGIAFLYNPYEVASYAQGQIIVFIPFTKIKKYLNPDFAQRIGIK